MRLTDLSPQLFGAPTNGGMTFPHVDTIGAAHGVFFLCPVCLAQNGGPEGTHALICWSPEIGQEIRPTPGRWSLHGTGLHDLTLRGSSDSVAVEGGCRAHFFVRGGEIIPA